MKTQMLRDLVAARVEGRWTQWAQEHPHLAEAIDRTRLVEVAVTRLRDDEQFKAAMRQADLDERTINHALVILAQVERLIAQLLP